MNLWRKLTIDWPCALGDWLWAVLVVAPAAFLDRLTFKRVVLLVILALAIIAFLQIASIDLAVVWGMDVSFYFDVLIAVMLITARTRARQMLLVVGRKIRQLTFTVSAIVGQYRNRGRQRRDASAMLRKRGSRNPKRSDDEPAAWIGSMYATGSAGISN
jgi:hypothetical protein